MGIKELVLKGRLALVPLPLKLYGVTRGSKRLDIYVGPCNVKLLKNTIRAWINRLCSNESLDNVHR